MSKAGVGLDIGTSSVKIVELHAQGGQNITSQSVWNYPFARRGLKWRGNQGSTCGHISH